MTQQNAAQIEIGGRPVGFPLTPAETALVLNWLESEGVADALAALRSPVVEQQPQPCPYAWEIDNLCREARERWLVYHPDEADFYRRERTEYTVTALYAAPVPALEQQPRAWECPKCGCFRPWIVGYCDGLNTGGHNVVKRGSGTPLYAGVPGAARETEDRYRSALVSIRDDTRPSGVSWESHAKRMHDIAYLALSSNAGNGESATEPAS